MKRFIAVLSGLLLLPAFAEVAPVYYDEIVEYSDDMIDAIDADEAEEATETAAQNTPQRTTANRSTSRAVSAVRNNTSTRSNASSRAMASSTRQTISRGTTSRGVKTVAGATAQKSSATRAKVTSRSERTNKPVTARVSAGTVVVPVQKGTSTSSYEKVTNLTDSGKPLYNANSVDASRISTTRRGATARISTITAPVITEADVTSTTSNLEAVAELTDYCKAQYAACMDNYCNVLDDNQGRCSCSKNIKNYQKVEEALTAATESFQDTVQKIKYLGLTSDQITALFSETEAELQMKSTTDSSQLKNSLDSIKKKIIDASSTDSSSYASTNVTLDLSGLLDFDLASGFDLSSFLGTNGSNSNVSNQRGEQLYKTATQRCKTAVLNSCTAQGIEASIVTNSYDLEIDKQCIAYERNLNDANDEMRNNVRNATTILQQARLLLAQQRNSYDLRGCVAALDSCMQDEYVCGSDYELCLDPTGKYLASGAVVKGGTPGVSGGTVRNSALICDAGTNTPSGCMPVDTWTSQGMYELYATWNYGGEGNSMLNAWGGGVAEKLGDYIEEKISTDYVGEKSPADMATYVLQKVGYIDKNDKVHGMCASVMKQCQDYTFSNPSKQSKKYKRDNEVLRQYLSMALTKIKLQQDAILADYAEDCRSDVSSCLSTNGYDETNPTITASKTAINACRSEIQTCMSVNGYKPRDNVALTLRMMSDWVSSMLTICPTNYYLRDTGGDSSSSNSAVECVVCPTQVSVPNYTSGHPNKVNLESGGGQETMCHCPEGYTDGAADSNGQPSKCYEAN